MTRFNENYFFFAKVKENAVIPTKEKENAGYDIYACFDYNYLIILPHSTKLIPTGIASAICDKYYLGVAERGSTGKIGMKYSAGIIDSGYRGEIFIAITNVNDVNIIISKLSKEELERHYVKDEEYIIYPYEKAIAQLIIHEVHNEVKPEEIFYNELKNIPSKRETGSLGSTEK